MTYKNACMLIQITSLLQSGGHYIGVVGTLTMAQAKRPLISPDAYSGDTSWTDWVDHFEATALVNGWDNAAKL